MYDLDNDFVSKLVVEFDKFTSQFLSETDLELHKKEVGHRHGEGYETKAVDYLIANTDFHVTEPKNSREIGDFYINEQKIPFNIKFGFQKSGQPNGVAMNRILKGVMENKLRQYFIASINILSDNEYEVMIFDLLQNLDVIQYNMGTGQCMLKETYLHELYKSDKLVVTEKFDKVKLLSDLQDMYTEGYHSHIEKKTADFNKMTDMLTETINTEKLFLAG